MQTPLAVSAIRERLPRAVDGHDSSPDCITIVLRSEHLVEACEILRDDPRLRCDILSVLAYTGQELIYQLVSTTTSSRLRIRVPVAGDQPTVDSTASVWPAARWAEREIQDHRGIVFANHPNPVPLFQRVDEHADPTIEPLGGTRYPTSLDGSLVRCDTDTQGRTTFTPILGRRHIDLCRQLTQVPYQQCASLMARVDGFAAHAGDLAYTIAVESLLDLTPPPRAQMLRTIYAECARIASHLYWLARTTQDSGDPAFIAPGRAWQARMAALDLMSQLGNGSPVPDVLCIGGLERDAPEGFAAALTEWSANMARRIDELEALIQRQNWIGDELDELGVIDPGTALGLGVTGPNLRACGVPYDVRTAFPYAGYAAIEVPGTAYAGGDSRCRVLVRMAELDSSLQIVRQAAAHLVPGPVCALDGQGLPDQLPIGEVYAAVEGPRGEWGVLLVSDGQPNWQCVQVRGPSFFNLSALPYLSRDVGRDHLVAVLNSLDISAGEVER